MLYLKQIALVFIFSVCLVCSNAFAEVIEVVQEQDTLKNQQDGEQLKRITLKDGQTLIGQVKCQVDQCELTSETGLQMTIKRSSIAKIQLFGERERMALEDPNRTRYLYSPSAFSLKEGEGYFSQKQLLFSSFAYGVTDQFTLIGGAILPLMFFGGDGFNFIFGGKYAFDLAQDWRLAFGTETFNFPSESIGLIQTFLGVTYGNLNGHITLNIGKPFAYENSNKTFADSGLIMMSLSGNLKRSKSVRLITENWLIFAANNLDIPIHMNSFAVRFQGASLASDLGLIFSGVNGELMPFPLPWFDFTFNF